MKIQEWGADNEPNVQCKRLIIGIEEVQVDSFDCCDSLGDKKMRP